MNATVDKFWNLQISNEQFPNAWTEMEIREIAGRIIAGAY